MAKKRTIAKRDWKLRFMDPPTRPRLGLPPERTLSNGGDCLGIVKNAGVGGWLPFRGASLTVSCGYANPVGWMPRWRAFLSPLKGLASPRLRVPTACAVDCILSPFRGWRAGHCFTQPLTFSVPPRGE